MDVDSTVSCVNHLKSSSHLISLLIPFVIAVMLVTIARVLKRNHAHGASGCKIDKVQDPKPKINQNNIIFHAVTGPNVFIIIMLAHFNMKCLFLWI